MCCAVGIAWSRGCTGCHGEQLQGRVFFSETGVGTLIAPNLTRLVTERTDAELERALRHGIRPDGRSLWVMPSEMIRSLTDDDIARLLAWMRSVPPVDGPEPSFRLGPLGRLGVALGNFQPSRHYIEVETPLSPPADSALRLGHYVATSTCTECHGNEMQGDDASPALPAVLTAYTLEEFAEFLQTGIAKGGRELPMMSGIARRRLSRLTEPEVRSLYAYLRSLQAK